MPHKSGYRAGIPQKEPYTKWDTDKDEIEVDYKQMDDSSPPSWFSGIKGQVLKILLLFTVFLVGLIIGYIIRRSVHEMILHPKKCDNQPQSQDYSREFSESISNDISAQKIEGFLKDCSKNVHITVNHNNILLRNKLQKQMKSHGLAVHIASYNVLISYTDWKHPSSVSLLDDNGTVIYETDYRGPNPQSTRYHPEIRQPFIAFSPNATVEGDIVYANYGTEDDFEQLKKANISCKGNIIIMRYGKLYRGLKVQNAESCGAVGVIMYSDPAEVTGQYTTRGDVYPHTWFLPNWTAQSGSILPKMEGDPLTPDLPSVEGMYRIDEDQAFLPKIPTLSISYGDAEELMKNMGGSVSKNEFHGSLSHPNVTYRLGPGYDEYRKNWRLRMEVNMDTDRRNIYNVIGVLKGNIEPDRYVIVGCHYDAWAYGAVDPGSGTSIIMELARVFGDKYQQGWRPRRTLMFIHWDAEEQGLMGSYEWVQEHEKELSERTVVYINLDGAVKGNHSLEFQANPMLNELLYNVTKMYQTPHSDGKSVYKQLKENCPKGCMHPLGPGSDQAPFVFLLGVAALWPMYTFNPQEHDFVSYPVYHTMIDTFQYVKNFIDPEFKAHEVMAKLVAELIYQLTSKAKLPFNALLLKTLLDNEYIELAPCFNNNNTLDPLYWAIGNFSFAAVDFQGKMEVLDPKDSLAIRRYNDKLLRVSQAFIYPQGLPDRPMQRNVLFAQSSYGGQGGKIFAGIHDAYYQFMIGTDKNSLQNEINKQISIATVAVRAATRLLQDVY